MAVEKFRNILATPITLTAGYTSGGGTLSVSSVAALPSTGDFAVAIGNAAKTIWRVTSVSGSDLIGGAEANDGNASIGATVILVESRVTAERFMQAPAANRIFADAGVDGIDKVGPWRPRMRHPVTASFGWGNQGAAAVDDQFGFTRLTCPSTGTNIRRRLLTGGPPGTPYVVDAVLQYKDSGSASRYGGLYFRETSTGKLHIFQFASTTNAFQVVNFSDDSTFFSNPANTTLEGSLLGSLAPFHIRVRDDGTNLKFTASREGLYYFTEISLGRTSYMAGGPNEIGFFGNVDGSAGVFEMDVFHWLVG